MTTHTIQFLKTYAADKYDAVQEAQDYITKRGFLDGFGIDRLARSGPQQSFAHRIKELLENVETEEQIIDVFKKAVQRILTTNQIFNSTSLGENMLSVAMIQEAQHLSEKIAWWEAMDAH